MTTIEQLMHATLHEVFGERDDQRRRAAIARVYATDVRFADADGVVTGRDALDVKARGILAGAPGFVFTTDGPARVVQDLGYQAWGFGPQGQPPVVRGADIALVAGGLITSLHTMLITG